MDLRTVDLIAGTRPNFMKIAPIVEAMQAAEPRVPGKQRLWVWGDAGFLD